MSQRLLNGGVFFTSLLFRCIEPSNQFHTKLNVAGPFDERVFSLPARECVTITGSFKNFAAPKQSMVEPTEARWYRETPTTGYFNQQNRILLVEVSREWLAQKTALNQDDVLHLKLSWNGTESRNYRLEATGKGSFETAVQVPESAADLKGEL